MTRFGFLFYNFALVATLYGMVYMTGNSKAALLYTLDYFSLPVASLLFLLGFLGLVRWFMTENPDILREAGTFLYAGGLSLALTYGVYRFLTHSYGTL